MAELPKGITIHHPMFGLDSLEFTITLQWTCRREDETAMEALARAESEGVLLDVREDELFWKGTPKLFMGEVAKYNLSMLASNMEVKEEEQ